ncbi:hypothetical protein TIFTF001_019421 [Ficus carica]|uniref:Uncharacterized protein n=1 Tax=Ficus carica TaxID=3494 RepID=A0AA88AWY2_FICCA|nr:hypothetical protein TIFTF001_019421 [Ficus carica]
MKQLEIIEVRAKSTRRLLASMWTPCVAVIDLHRLRDGIPRSTITHQRHRALGELQPPLDLLDDEVRPTMGLRDHQNYKLPQSRQVLSLPPHNTNLTRTSIPFNQNFHLGQKNSEAS